MFDEHASGGLLGLSLPRTLNDDSHPVDGQFIWTEESISIRGRSTEYHLGITLEGMDLSRLEVLYRNHVPVFPKELILACFSFRLPSPLTQFKHLT